MLLSCSGARKKLRLGAYEIKDHDDTSNNRIPWWQFSRSPLS